MDELTTLRTFAACTKVVAAALVAANMNARVTVAGFVIFIVASITWMADAWFDTKSSLMIQNAILLFINILGVWRWLPRLRKRQLDRKPHPYPYSEKVEDGIMPSAQEKDQKAVLTREEWRARRELRREKQRKDNILRAGKMHAARLKIEKDNPTLPPQLKSSIFVGCSGWRYWKWRDSFYAGVPQNDWFEHYLKSFDTVEINASFYSWPTVAGVQAWRRQPGKKKFVYTVKVCELITHIKKFKGTKTLVKDFGMIADILGDRMGCFLFQLPPSYRYTKVRLNDIVSQLDPARRNVVEFRHASWWNDEVYDAVRKAGIIFCSCSGPRLPDELIRTADEVYIRLHGPKRWYRHDYSKGELAIWADRIKANGAKRAWVYFNNDNDAHAPKNAAALRRMLGRVFPGIKKGAGTLPVSQAFSDVWETVS